MNYTEAVEYVESLAIFGSQPGFERINALLEELGHPEKNLKYVHVAGTNGKGSVCTEISNILIDANYKTGLFTSPYVSDFRERIQFCGEYIEKDIFSRLVEIVKKATEKIKAKGIQPTEFEVITAIAFLYFKEKECDIVILEAGLGGLLDSTNVISAPIVSAIVSISLDHTAVLGNTIEEIAIQKAGIIKDHGVTVIAPNQPTEAKHIIRTSAFEHENKLVIAKLDNIEKISESIFGSKIKYKDTEIQLPLIGSHQIENLSVALAVIEELKLKGYKISMKNIKNGIEKTSLPARVEIINENPLVIIDGGHNAEGAVALRDSLVSLLPNAPKTLVIGLMADKDVDTIVSTLAPISKRIITTTPSNPRALSAEKLASKVSAFCDEVEVEPSPCKAFDLAKNALSKGECLIVCGSLYLAGDIREHAKESLKNN